MATSKSPRTPASRSRSASPPDRTQIAERAYYLWLEDPMANGDPVANWLRAEAELTAPAKPKPKAPTRRTTKASPRKASSPTDGKA